MGSKAADLVCVYNSHMIPHWWDDKIYEEKLGRGQSR